MIARASSGVKEQHADKSVLHSASHDYHTSRRDIEQRMKRFHRFCAAAPSVVAIMMMIMITPSDSWMLRSKGESVLQRRCGYSASIFLTLSKTTRSMALNASSSGSNRSSTSRRDWIQSNVIMPTFLLALAPSPVYAKQQATESTNPLPELIEAQETLGTLLDNWKRATIDCTYADVPRELLEQKNKELLLEKASTFALFDKSVSVESCKTTNRIVRDYLGVTGKGPLVGVEKKLNRGLNYLDDVDDLDAYVSELESFSQAYSRASSLSHTAGIADFDSVNNFSKEEADSVGNTNSNLNQARVAIGQAKSSLDVIVSLLQKGQS